MVEAALNGEEILLLKNNQPVIKLLSLETNLDSMLSPKWDAPDSDPSLANSAHSAM
jgi:hypothetical protein